MKSTWPSSIAAILLAILIVLSAACAGPVKNEKQLQSAVENMQKFTQSKLSNLDNALSDAAVKIAKSGLQGDETRGILNGLCKKYPYLVDCSTADTVGKMITVAPEDYRHYEGTDTATTEQSKKYFQDLGENKKSSFSNVFSSVEGIDAVVLVRPVVTEEGKLIGFICALFKPEALLEETVKSAAEVRAMDVDVMQTDGLTIYSTDASEIGTNLLTDQRYKGYPDLVAMGVKMASQQTGSAKYSYIDHTTGQPAKKTAFWTSVGLHGTEWRMVGIAVLDK
jgi:hypothetical protein